MTLAPFSQSPRPTSASPSPTRARRSSPWSPAAFAMPMAARKVSDARVGSPSSSSTRPRSTRQRSASAVRPRSRNASRACRRLVRVPWASPSASATSARTSWNQRLQRPGGAGVHGLQQAQRLARAAQVRHRVMDLVSPHCTTGQECRKLAMQHRRRVRVCCSACAEQHRFSAHALAGLQQHGAEADEAAHVGATAAARQRVFEVDQGLGHVAGQGAQSRGRQEQRRGLLGRGLGGALGLLGGEAPQTQALGAGGAPPGRPAHRRERGEELGVQARGVAEARREPSSDVRRDAELEVQTRGPYGHVVDGLGAAEDRRHPRGLGHVGGDAAEVVGQKRRHDGLGPGQRGVFGAVAEELGAPAGCPGRRPEAACGARPTCCGRGAATPPRAGRAGGGRRPARRRRGPGRRRQRGAAPTRRRATGARRPRTRSPRGSDGWRRPSGGRRR
jgi:hypothetical protein